MQFALENVNASTIDSQLENLEEVFGGFFSFLEEDPRLDEVTEDFSIIVNAENFEQDNKWFIKRLLNSKLEEDWSVWRIREVEHCSKSNILTIKLGSISLEEGINVY